VLTRRVLSRLHSATRTDQLAVGEKGYINSTDPITRTCVVIGVWHG